MSSMQLHGLVAAALLATGCAVPRPFGEGVALHTFLSAGSRVIANDERDVFDGDAVYGLELASCEADSGWGYELGGTYGNERPEGAPDQKAEFFEGYLGLRRTWRGEEALRPYLGLGGAVTRIDLGLPSQIEAQEEGAGLYAHAGVLWRLGKLELDRSSDVLVGFDARGFLGEDYDSAQLTFVVGFGR